MTDRPRTTEQKRAEASGLKGVWYDARAGKFAAEVYSCGQRHFLGLFDLSADAAAAYDAARTELPSGRNAGGTFVDAFAAFLADCAKDGEGRPAVGSVLVYRDQPFTFDGVTFRLLNRKRRPFFRWVSDCVDCGVLYETLTSTSPEMANGITRTCEEHRRRGKRAQAAGDQAPLERRRLSDVDERVVAVSNEAAANLSLIDDCVPLEVFRAECKRLWPDMPNSKPYWRFDDRSPVDLVTSSSGLLARFR